MKTSNTKSLFSWSSNSFEETGNKQLIAKSSLKTIKEGSQYSLMGRNVALENCHRRIY